MTDEEFLARLRNLALRFDHQYGQYPEHMYEGQVFFEFVHEALTGEPQEQNEEWWIREVRDVE